MESDDQTHIPTPPSARGVAGEPSPAAAVTDSQIGGLFGVGSRWGRSGEWQPPSPEELQHDFPQHEIRGILGRGGMGAVYKAWQKSLERFVAIKIRPPGFDDGISDFTERFKREAKAMAHLKHPGIVAVYDAGETPGGLRYFIMECVEGTDVHKLLAGSGRIEQPEALRITVQVCHALGYAHAHGVIHRDIKPSNIMIEADGEVKVADFGLAKSTDDATTMLTLSDVTMGTPDYMAPEAVKGAAQTDYRADLYSVGVMLYEMLTGKLPRGKYAPPSRIVPGLDRRLDKVVDRALQPRPEARYQNAREMTDALEPIFRTVAGGTVVSPRKKPVLIGVAATVMIGSIAALVHFQPWKNHGARGGVRPGVASASAGDDGAPRAATKAMPFVNSLGQKFVPVPGTRVLFCKWETRVRDYAAFAKVRQVDDSWKKQEKLLTGNTFLPVSVERDHPVCGVSWDDAKAFCKWLTEKETAEGRLPKGMSYRLPTDEEWSRAVGLASEDGATPKERHKRNDTDYPWGTEFPPPPKVGNYADSTYHEMSPASAWIQGYTDGFALTAPVGSFPANQYGIHDLGGNVWEWCEDHFDPAGLKRTGRGASWVNTPGTRGSLFSSYRMDELPEKRQRDLGFRVVLDLGGK